VKEAKNAIIKAVAHKAGRMQVTLSGIFCPNGTEYQLTVNRFLWVVHVLRSIFRDNSELRTPDNVHADILKDRLPETVKELYGRTFATLYGSESSHSSRRGERALKLLLCERKPLSSYGFIDAVRAGEVPRPLVETVDYSGEVDTLISSRRGFLVHYQKTRCGPLSAPVDCAVPPGTGRICDGCKCGDG
jgi:hypothetical protein